MGQSLIDRYCINMKILAMFVLSLVGVALSGSLFGLHRGHGYGGLYGGGLYGRGHYGGYNHHNYYHDYHDYHHHHHHHDYHHHKRSALPEAKPILGFLRFGFGQHHYPHYHYHGYHW